MPTMQVIGVYRASRFPVCPGHRFFQEQTGRSARSCVMRGRNYHTPKSMQPSGDIA
jgi:hypothetical protein